MAGDAGYLGLQYLLLISADERNHGRNLNRDVTESSRACVAFGAHLLVNKHTA
jgi:hypothetical protein